MREWCESGCDCVDACVHACVCVCVCARVHVCASKSKHINTDQPLTTHACYEGLAVSGCGCSHYLFQ